MTRAMTVALVALVDIITVPSTALAAQDAQGASTASHFGVSLLGLVVAVVLLLEALKVRRVAFGGAIAERIVYVVLAIVCLAASALGQWVQKFVVGMTQSQVDLASELLVIVAMGLLAAYFFGVRTALQSYLASMTGPGPSAGPSADLSDSGEA